MRIGTITSPAPLPMPQPNNTEGISVDEITNLTEENVRELDIIEEYLSLNSNPEGE